MKLTPLVHRWFAKLNLPVGLLMVFLQRSPALRAVATAVEFVLESPWGNVAKSALATAATLGGIHTIAGATELSASTPSPAQLTVGVNASIAFGVLGTQTPPTSWIVGGTLPPGMTFQGGRTTGTIAADTLNLSGSPTTAGNFSISLVARDDPLGLDSPTFNYNFVVSGAANVAPSITTQPSGQTVIVGSTVIFSGGASGTPAPTFQWRKNGNNIGGATGTTLTLNNVQAGDAGDYTFVATNSAGSATSNIATLTVNPAPSAPSFTLQPSSQTVIAGNSVTFTAAADGNPAPTYQWRKDGVNIGGATNSSYAIPSTALGDAGTYTVVASNASGSITSNGAILTVNPATAAPIITTQPASQAIISGNPVTFTVVASGNPAPTFQWRKDGVNIGGATNSSYLIGAVTPADAGSYSVVATNSQGNATSNAAVLTVQVPPAITQQPSDQVVNAGGTATLTVAASGTPGPGYQWRRNGIAIPGATGATLTINNAAAIHAGVYTVVAANGAGAVTSNAVTLTVRTESSIWLMNGTAFKFGVSLGYRDSNWQLVTAADFNGDNKPDILLQNVVTGERQIQLLDGATQTNTISLGVVDPNWQMVAAVDFNGDNKPDIVLQNTVTGQRSIWLMNGTVFSSSLDLGTYDLSWRIATAADFDGDGKADLLWQNTITGECTIWLMNGTQFIYGVNLGTYDLKWRMAAVADFDGDGKVDIIWQDAITGQRNLWLMNGTQFVFGVDLGTYDLSWRIVAVADFDHDGKKDILWQSMSFGQTGTADLGIVDANWKIAGTGDFNGDHNPDIVWQNLVTGQRSIWLMNGGAFGYSADLGALDPSWQIAAIADFNHDGQSDLVWQNTTTGERSIWLMNGTTFGSAVSLGMVDPNWRIATAADFNGDGNPDIVWQNLTTGQRAMWLMNGPAYFFGIDLGTVDTNWKISAAADFTGDGKPDILWQNTATGQAIVWRMNGVLGITPLDFGTYDLNLQCVGAADFDHRGGPDLLWQNTVTGQRSIFFISGSGY